MSRHSSRIHSEETPLVQLLNRIVDFGIGGVLFVAPLAMAGRYEPGRLLLALIIGITAIAWFGGRVLSKRSHSHWFWTGAEWICLSAVLLVALQLTSWSPGMLGWINPELGELLPLHVTSASTDEITTELPQLQVAESVPDASAPEALVPAESNAATFAWDQATLTPHLTRGGMATLLIFVLFFFVVLQRVRRRADVERMLKGMALAGVFLASLGLVQYVINNGRFLWFMSHPSRDTLTSVKATFANENHFAHFLALTMGPLLWWLVKVQGESKDDVDAEPKFGSTARNSSIPQLRVLLCIGIGIVFVAGLLTYSKGGLVVMTLAAMITIALLVFQRRVGKKAVIAVCTAGVVAALAVFIHGQDILVRELESLQDVSLESWDADQGRRKIWTAVLTAAPNFATLGSGVGSHRYIYPTYFSSDSAVQYTHAESGYLNVLLETGGPGLGLLLVGIGLTVYWAWKAFDAEDEEVQFLAVPLIACIAVSLIHAVFDFNWYIPANLTLTLIVVALSARLWDLSAGGKLHRIRVNKLTWAGMAAAAVMVSVYSVSHYVGPARGLPAWHEFRAWSLATRGGGNGRRGELQNLDAMDPETIGHMIELLDEVLKHDPGHGRAHVRMASMCMRQFELLQAKSDSRMPLAEIRDAAKTSDFDSHQAMSDWVDRVVQDNRVYLDRILWHSKQGIRYTPTEGNAYLYLAEVAFLDESIQATEHDLMRQAYAVRPYEPAIQFSLGRHELLAGNQAGAMELWKDAFNRGDSVRQRIIAAVGFQAPPQEILDLFQPDMMGLRDLFQYYRRREFVPQMNFIAKRFVVELEKQAKLMTGETAGDLWREAQFVHATLGNTESAATAAKNSVMVDPTNFENHYSCGLRMRDCERFEEAAKEFRWCASRKPENPELRKIVAEMKNRARQLAATHAATIEQSRFQRQNAGSMQR